MLFMLRKSYFIFSIANENNDLQQKNVKVTVLEILTNKQENRLFTPPHPCLMSLHVILSEFLDETYAAKTREMGWATVQ